MGKENTEGVDLFPLAQDRKQAFAICLLPKCPCELLDTFSLSADLSGLLSPLVHKTTGMLPAQ